MTSFHQTKPPIQRQLGSVLTCVFLFLIHPLMTNVSAVDYYVAVNGLDSQPGTMDLPWRTISHAASTLLPGDTVFVRAGDYPEHVIPERSGIPGAEIRYSAYPGEMVTIDGQTIDLPEWSGLFDMSGREYIRVSGFHVVNAGPTIHNSGILADTSNHIVIERNTTNNTSESGILVWNCSDVLIDGNTVESACFYLYNECITVGASTRCDVSNNIVFNSPKEGICIKDGSSFCRVFGNIVHNTEATGFYVDAQAVYTHSIEVFNNISYDGVEDGFTVASEVGGLLENISLYNNIAYNNGWVGFDISDCCIEAHPLNNIRIINNTSVGNGVDWGGGIVVQNTQVSNIVIRNNIVSNNLSFQIAATTQAPSGSITIDHNLIDGFRDGEDETRGTDFLEGDPFFVAPQTFDYHIQSSSLAIDQGSAIDAPSWDMDMTNRPQSAGVDIGADEFTVNRPSISTTLIMPSLYFVPGDRCFLEAILYSPASSIDSAPFVCILDVFGEYWFWPGWLASFDSRLISESSGYHTIPLIPEFIWPETGPGAVNGIVFWAAMTNSNYTEILGGEFGLGRWEFGFGPDAVL